LMLMIGGTSKILRARGLLPYCSRNTPPIEVLERKFRCRVLIS
jgi:hypothetical protein